MNCTVDLSDRLLPINNEWPDERSDYQKKHWPNMPKEVAAALAADGYRMLEPFRTATKAIKCVCPAGHGVLVKWHSFKGGHRCKPCADERLKSKQVERGRRKRAEMAAIVEDAMRAKGCTPLSRYVNGKTPLRYICPKGHHTEGRWCHFKSKVDGVYCGECAGRVIHNENVRNAFMAVGYEALSDYKSSHVLIPFLCDRGHEHAISWANFGQGIRCGVCFPAGYNASKPGTIYYVRFDLEGGQLWKIGITNKTVKHRFREEKIPHTVLWSERYEDGGIPIDIERKIIEAYKAHKYTGRALKSGNTECFTIDVLGYDKPIAQLSLFV